MLAAELVLLVLLSALSVWYGRFATISFFEQELLRRILIYWVVMLTGISVGGIFMLEFIFYPSLALFFGFVLGSWNYID